MLSLRIALRYLFSKKRHNAVNIISAISIAGVAIATAAIIVVLSVFNGFSRLSQSQLSRINPDILVTPAAGKVFNHADSIASAIGALPEVATASPVIEERAMLVAGNSQVPVVFKAVSDIYNGAVTDIDSLIIDGIYASEVAGTNAMQISVGVANRSGLRPGMMSIADLYVPRRKGRINPANPAASFRNRSLLVSGVFQSEQSDIDNDCVIIPLSVAEELLDYNGQATSIEISLRDKSESYAALTQISDMLGCYAKVLDKRMQQEDSFRMIEIEKWITFMMLLFILVIASFNIISTLSLLVVEKRTDASTFRALGASKKFVRSIFISQGFLITITGGIAGIVCGVILSLLQQHFGLIKLAGDPSNLTIDVYPVAVEATDIAIVAAAITIVAIITSQITRLFTNNIK